MCEKLLVLCKLQLGSILSDLEKSADGVNAAATSIMDSFNQQVAEDAQEQSRELAQSMNSELRNIIVGLQFHDELTQRLQHLHTLLGLLEEQPQSSGVDTDHDKLVKRLSKIFSSNAEFNQLRKVFPGCQISGSTDAIELF